MRVGIVYESRTRRKRQRDGKPTGERLDKPTPLVPAPQILQTRHKPAFSSRPLERRRWTRDDGSQHALRYDLLALAQRLDAVFHEPV